MIPRRWQLMFAFQLVIAINYLDRQVLPSLAPVILEEFQLTREQFGILLTAFSLTYAFGAPFAGWLIDRLGLTRGISIACGAWSIAAIGCGLGSGLASLAAWRAALGLAQAGGIPAGGKAIRTFLHPDERALGNATGQLAISLGLIAAPPLAIWIAGRANWRWSFIVTGALGLLWIPLWNRIAPAEARTPAPSASAPLTLLRDSRTWIFALANGLVMILYSLWTNWSVLYLKETFRLSNEAAAGFAAVPPIAATLGALAGGAIAMRWIRSGTAVVDARLRAGLVASLLALSTAAIPFAPSPTVAVALIGVSFFAVSVFSVNLYSLPLDVFDPSQAALGVAMLTSSYGAMQAVFSPLAGRLIDTTGYAPLLTGCAATPFAAWVLLKATRR